MGRQTESSPLCFSSIPLSICYIFAAARAMEFVLKRLDMPSYLSHVLGGVLLGPSVFGQVVSAYILDHRDPFQPYKDFYGLIFGNPNGHFHHLLTSMMALLFNLLIGMKLDLHILERAGKKAMAIGVFSMILPVIGAIIIFTHVTNQGIFALNNCFLPVTSLVANTEFITLSTQLKEQNMLTSKLGRLANSAAVASTAITWIAGFASYVYNSRRNAEGLWVYPVSVGALLTNVLMIYFVTKRICRWIISRTKSGEDISKNSMLVLFVFVIFVGALNDVLGMSAYGGALFVGFFIPCGPPISSSLVRRLEGFVTGVLLPIVLANIGSKTDLLGMVNMDMTTYGLQLVSICTVLKFIGAVIPCLYCKMPFHDALLIGQMMISRGIYEMILYKQWLKLYVNLEFFTAMVLLSILLGWLNAFIIKRAYEPSLRYLSYRRRTVQHTKPGDPLRVIMCVHNTDHAAQLTRLLDSTIPTTKHPIHAYVLQLVPLMGQAAAALAPLWREGLPKPPESAHISAILNLLERRHPRNVVALPYLSMAPRATMHDDICSLALDKKAALVLLPFHGTNAANQNICLHVLSYAPCSVGILINHGPERDKPFDQVGVIFLGGRDDRECIAYGMRIANSPTASVTVIRFHLKELRKVVGREKELDEIMIREFQAMTEENERLTYREETLADLPGMVRAVRDAASEFDLLLVGRREAGKSGSQMALALGEWSEYPELGVVGDVLATEDFKGKVSTLVLQQQARVAARVSR